MAIRLFLPLRFRLPVMSCEMDTVRGVLSLPVDLTMITRHCSSNPGLDGCQRQNLDIHKLSHTHLVFKP